MNKHPGWGIALLVLQAQETTPPGRPAPPHLYRQGCPWGVAVYNPPRQETAQRPISWRSATDKPRSQWREDRRCGVPPAVWSTVPRQGEAKRVKRGHCEPVSEPVTAPTHPPGRLSQAQLTLDLKGQRRWPAAGTTATWPGRTLDFYGHGEDSTCYCSNY